MCEDCVNENDLQDLRSEFQDKLDDLKRELEEVRDLINE